MNKAELVAALIAAKEAPEALAPAPYAPAAAYAPAPAVPAASAPVQPDYNALWDGAIARVNQSIRAARERGF